MEISRKDGAYKILKDLTPPLIWRVARKAKHLFHNTKPEDDIFDGHGQLFKKVAKNATLYGEYGCGASTVWMAKNTSCLLRTVDTDKIWINHITKQIDQDKGLTTYHADFGTVKEWGRPSSYKNWRLFNIYTDWLWSFKEKPDLVLVDGRFRVCCFLTSLINANSSAKIIFDDYDRKHYHIVEEFVKPKEIYGRQALFEVPKKEALPANEIKEMIGKFRFVFD